MRRPSKIDSLKKLKALSVPISCVVDVGLQKINMKR